MLFVAQGDPDITNMLRPLNLPITDSSALYHKALADFHVAGLSP